jgi:beta-lactamase class A
MKKKLRRRLKALFFFSVFLLIIFLGFTVYFQIKLKTQEKALNDISLKSERQAKEYSDCLVKKYVKTDNVEDKIDEIDNYIKNNYPYSSILYYDLNSTLKYAYNEDTVYYGASLIKTLDALYLYNKAIEDSSILDEKLTYTSNYQRASSLGMQKYTFGTKVAIKDLI